jgi:hypothetical protein
MKWNWPRVVALVACLMAGLMAFIMLLAVIVYLAMQYKPRPDEATIRHPVIPTVVQPKIVKEKEIIRERVEGLKSSPPSQSSLQQSQPPQPQQQIFIQQEQQQREDNTSQDQGRRCEQRRYEPYTYNQYGEGYHPPIYYGYGSYGSSYPRPRNWDINIGIGVCGGRVGGNVHWNSGGTPYVPYGGGYMTPQYTPYYLR